MTSANALFLQTRRLLLALLTLSLCAGFPVDALARGGGGHGSNHGEMESHGGRHGGEGIEDHGHRHGSIVQELPRGYTELSHHGNNYYFHEGRFFSRHRNGFMFVAAPIGLIVPSLAVGAVTISVGGIPYYVVDDNYYRRTADGYIVVEPPHR